MTEHDNDLSELEGGNGLGFHIEQRRDTHVIVDYDHGVRPATWKEVALWDSLQGWLPPEEVEELRAALAQLIGAVEHLSPCPGTLERAKRAVQEKNDENDIRERLKRAGNAKGMVSSGFGRDSAYSEIEQHRDRLAREGQEPVAHVDYCDDEGLFVEIIYGNDGSPLEVGDYLYKAPPAGRNEAEVKAETMERISEYLKDEERSLSEERQADAYRRMSFELENEAARLRGDGEES